MKVPLFVPRYMIKKTVLVLFFQSDERTLELAVSSEKSCSFHSPSPASPPADRMGLPFKPGHIRSAVTLSNADPDLLDLYPARSVFFNDLALTSKPSEVLYGSFVALYLLALA